jgi:mannose-6-phosphate isomerase-like protein (cupin superfamily)
MLDRDLGAHAHRAPLLEDDVLDLHALQHLGAEVVRVEKPWGYEIIWAHTDSYVGKILHINAGHALSVQYHEVKDETVYLLSGRLVYRVWQNGQPTDVDLQVGQAFRITPHTIHQMEAITDCDVLEVSTPELDDVVRLEDRYGRS